MPPDFQRCVFLAAGIVSWFSREPDSFVRIALDWCTGQAAMFSLSWTQVNAWRLSQHHLLQRADRGRMLDVVTQVGGLQAQLLSAAELSLWARVEGLSAADVADALWRDRTLVKTWAMRGTLHILTSRDLPCYVAARGAYRVRRPPSWYNYHRVRRRFGRRSRRCAGDPDWCRDDS